MNKVRVIQGGIGPIGSKITKLLAGNENIEIAGALDVDRAKVGKDLGEVAGLGKLLGIPITDDVDALLYTAKADVAVYSTSSHMEQIYPQLVKPVEAGLNVVSTCEDLVYPFNHFPELSQKVDALAKRHGVTVLSTGINPGFVMDMLPLALTAVCQDIKSVKITRIVDTGKRRMVLQRKMGAGLTVDEFKARAKAKSIGHVGLTISMAMIADGMGWKLDEVKESIEPMVAESDVRSQYLEVKKGWVAGTVQQASGVKDGKEVISMYLRSYIGASHEEHDEILIDATPRIDMVVRGGVSGDFATANIVVNSIPVVLKAQPGLLSMKDIPLVLSFASS